MSLSALALDPALPGLEAATDEDAMREAFRRHLRPAPGSTWEIERCRISRIHYHRGERCTLRYTLALVDPRSGRERNQWVTGLMYAGERAERIWRKLRAEAAAEQTRHVFATFEPLSFVPEPAMLVQTFPYDRRLPTLSQLATPPVPELEHAVAGEFGPGGRAIEAWTAEPVQYRPGRVAVLRYTVDAAEPLRRTTEQRRFYVKVYRHEDEAERAHRVHRTLWARAGARGVTVPRPIAYVRDLRAVVAAEMAGSSLRRLVLDNGDAAAVPTAARFLAAAHREPAAELPRHRLADEIATLGRARQILDSARPDLGARIDRIVRAVEAGLDDIPPSSTHRELRSDHVFLDGSGVGVVDLDSYAAADPLLDPARLLADLAGLSLRPDLSGDGRCESAAAAFAEEYLRAVPATWRRRLYVHYAGALLKEAVDCFRHQEPQWPETVAALVEDAEDALSGRAAWAA